MTSSSLKHLTRRPALLAALAGALLLTGFLFVLFLLSPPGNGGRVLLADFAKGGSLRRFADSLEAGGVIRSPRLFVLYARLRGADARLQAGTYRFTDALSPADILDKMVRGDVYELRFAVPEGYSIYQVAELLDGRRIFPRDRFLAAGKDPVLLADLGLPGKSVEGYLFPSTYGIRPGMDEKGVIRLMVETFKRNTGGLFPPGGTAHGLSRHQLVTLASMVEKEAVVPGEQPLIASVFLNRLRKGMPLQSDPTSVYGVRAFSGKVTKADILRDTPYNTYRIKGLPPGPIGNPGSLALAAVLKPAVSPYLYFVARNDGTHQFSTSLEEHNRAVRTYLKDHRPVSGISDDKPHSAGRR